MKKLVEYLESQGGETTLRFVFRAAVLLSMLVMLFFAASGSGYAQATRCAGSPEQAVAGNYLRQGMPAYNAGCDGKDAAVHNAEVRVKIYPEAVSDYLLVLLPALIANTTLQVLNPDGNVVAIERVQPGEANAVLDVRSLPLGTYLLFLDNGLQKEPLKFEKM